MSLSNRSFTADDRPSRFLVDLKTFVRRPGLLNPEIGPSRLTIGHRLASGCPPAFTYTLPEPVPSIFSGKSKFLNGFKREWRDLERLAFYPLLVLAHKLVGKFFIAIYRLCYALGWAAVFTVKFLFLASFYFLKAQARFFYGLGSKVKALTGLALSRSWLYRTRQPGKNDGPSVPLDAPESGSLAVSRKKVFFDGYVIDLNAGKDECEPALPGYGRTRPDKRVALNKFFSFPRPYVLKPVIYFAVLLLAVSSPLKALTYQQSFDFWRGRVLGASEAAVNDMVMATRSASGRDFVSAQENFSRASDNFREAEEEIAAISFLLGLLRPVAPADEVRLAAQAGLVLKAGQAAAELGGDLASAMTAFSAEPPWDMNAVFADFSVRLKQGSRHAALLNSLLHQVETDDLPMFYQDEFLLARDKSALLAGSLKEMEKLADSLKIFLGFDYDRRYLLVFQNNSELRASGGFIGSYAVADIRNGQIKNITTPGGGSYDTEAGLKSRVVAPEPLWLVNPLWHFWDANWWPDWPTTARKLMWFYEESDGSTVDGVISLTPTVMEDVLRAIGPVELGAEYDLTLTADNFWAEIQALAERKPAVTTTPKKVIGDTLAVIKEELPARLQKKMFFDLLKAMEKNLTEKQILFYFTDSRLQSSIIDFGWDGAVKPTVWDYLMVVNTNIAGAKSDRVMAESIDHRSQINYDGSIVNTVKIKRVHNGIKNDPFTGARNVNWLRVYVPAGSELLAAGGFNRPDDGYFETPEPHWQTDPDVEKTEGQAVMDPGSGTKIYRDSGKTVFANWVMVDPGQTAEVYFQYRLPFRLEKSASPAGWQDNWFALVNPDQKDLLPYAFLAQKQPGAPGSLIKSQLFWPTNFQAVGRYPGSTILDRQGWQIEDSLTTDKYWAVLLTAD
ncbi:MAG: DUF4012 domain-containing protein [Planctomycetes bacterium]|nr:DUF4012 domain-containing protein [Planctomycetota bacterium]